MDEEERRAKLIEARRCVECGLRLKGSDQGALCSPCYFELICDPAQADPVPQWSPASER